MNSIGGAEFSSNCSSPARYALSRLSDNLISLPLPRALVDLVTSTTNREHAKVYHQAGALLHLVGQPEFLDRDLAAIIASLVPTFIGDFLVPAYLNFLLKKGVRTVPQ